MTSKDSFYEVAFNISFWTRNISSARILFWRGVQFNFYEWCLEKKIYIGIIYVYSHYRLKTNMNKLPLFILEQQVFFLISKLLFYYLYFVF